MQTNATHRYDAFLGKFMVRSHLPRSAWDGEWSSDKNAWALLPQFLAQSLSSTLKLAGSRLSGACLHDLAYGQCEKL